MAAAPKSGWHADLLASEGVDCYGLVRLAMRRLGVGMDSDPLAESLKGSFREVTDRPRAGDILVMETAEEGGIGQHLAVCIDGWNAMHAAGCGVRVDRIEALQRTGRVERRVRAVSLMERRPAEEVL